MNMRRLRMGLNTIFGFKKQGFFIPYRYADGIPSAKERSLYPEILKEMQKTEGNFREFLIEMDKFSQDFSSFGSEPAPEPRWEQDWFPRMDGAAAYTMVRDAKPNRIIEVGSGHSTRFMVRAIRDGGLKTKVTAIDPAPRADISTLPIDIHRKTVQEVDRSIFEDLQPGDILFVDSSHIAMPGTDVDLLFSDILPSISAGVILHIHDICLPFDYPEIWEWRGYNEQQVVAPMITGGGYELLFSSQYIFHYMRDALDRSVIGKISVPEGAFETSLWLKKTI